LTKVNIGLLGVGGQGKKHLLNCLRLEETKLLGVADASEKALQFARRIGIKNVYTNFDDLLNNKHLDAVIISLPNFLHLESTLKAAEAGKDILLEKPLARNVEEGERILSSIKKNGVRLMLGYQLRFVPVLNEIREKIIDGFFGEVQIAEATNIGSGPFASRSEVPSWWFDKELVGGGALCDLGSHLINLLTWYFGEVTYVRSFLGHMFNMDSEDFASCILKFRNGPVATINVGWFSKDRNVQTMQICGTAKNILIHFYPSNTFGVVWNDLKKKLHWPKHDPMYSELKYFVECLQKNETPYPSGEEGLCDLKIISLAYDNASEYASKIYTKETEL
jgi:predicted dehydrogenase